MRGAMRRSLRIAAVLCSARGLVAPARRAAPTRLMASASGAPEDETRGGTASLADQVARARTRVGTRLRARVERDGSVLRRESALRCAAARGRRADERESTTVRLAASRREVEREHALRRREREAAHSRQKTHSSPKRKRTTTGATSTSRACLTGRRSRASGWRSRAAAAG